MMRNAIPPPLTGSKFCSSRCRYSLPDRHRFMPAGTTVWTSCWACDEPFSFAETTKPVGTASCVARWRRRTFCPERGLFLPFTPAPSAIGSRRRRPRRASPEPHEWVTLGMTATVTDPLASGSCSTAVSGTTQRSVPGRQAGASTAGCRGYVDVQGATANESEQLVA